MAEKKFSTMIFLLGAFIFLAMFIAMWIYGIYVDKASYAKTVSTSSIKCTSYAFDIKNLNYDDGKLSFDVENTMGDEFSELIVEGANQQSEKRIIQLYNFQSGMMQHVDLLNMTIDNEVLMYPTGCKDANDKKYNI